MLKSVLTTALRNIVRNRTFSVIILIGLSVSMSLALLIIIIIREQLTFDNFHADADRIFRVNTMAIRRDGQREPYASTPLPIARVLKDEYAFAEQVVRINRQLNGDAVYGNVNVPVSGLFVDPSFLNVFNFPLEKGNPLTALKEPNGLVLTQESSKKIFGEQDPVGQSVTLKGYGDFVVTGLLKKIAGKTHFDFEVLASSAILPLLEKQRAIMPCLDDWNNYYTGYVYFKLRNGRDREEVVRALTSISKKYYSNLKLETRDSGYEFYLQPLTKITPGPELSNQMGRGLPDVVLIFLATLAGIVMIMACFNYTNLMIAKSLSRAREIGIRKVVGAKRWQVFFQFVGEAVVFSVLSLGFSYLLMQFLKPAFLNLHITKEFAVDLQEDYLAYALFLLFAIGVGVMAGLLPAAYLSAFRPVKVLKDFGSLKVYSKLTFRKMLMVAQFTLSLIFIIVVFVIYRQVNFVLSADYGIHEKDIINVRLQGMEFSKLAVPMRAIAGVTRVGGVSHSLGTWQDRSSDYKKSSGDQPFEVRDFIVDENYLTDLEVEFLAGRNFEDTPAGAREKEVVLNQTALLSFGFQDPVSAIGQTLYVDDTVELAVIGVVKDFHFRPFNYRIGPLALRHHQNGIEIVSARMVPGQKETVVTALQTIWKSLDPVHKIDWKMMDDEIDQAYVDSGFTDALTVTGYIAFLAVMLACLGMLGMAMYSIQVRVKEIGVRKVMGASESNIVLLLSYSFLQLIALAALIGTPIGYFLSRFSLSSYAYRVEVTPWLLLGGIGLITIMGLLTIGSQTIKAATSDPVKSLRYE